MDATTMPSTPSLLPKVIADFPEVTFIAGEEFLWSPSNKTVFYVESEPHSPLLLHELAHGLLDHHEYDKDIELVAIENKAWEKAREIGTQYGVSIDEDLIQDHLDTYREWLHARSTCPSCEATGFQTGKEAYRCVACLHEWRVNEARLCGLKRYSLTK